MHNEPPFTAEDMHTMRTLAGESTHGPARCASLSHGRTVACRIRPSGFLQFTFQPSHYTTVLTLGLLHDDDCADFLRHRLEYAARHQVTHDNPRSVSADTPTRT